MAAMCEISYQSEGLMPELSYGSHFFQDLVESGVFYIALFKEQENVIFHEERLKGETLLTKYHPDSAEYADVIKVIDAKGMELYSDICRQRVFCRQNMRTAVKEKRECGVFAAFPLWKYKTTLKSFKNK